MPIIDCHTHVGISINAYLATDSYPYAMSLESLIVRMDYLGIDQAIVFPYQSSYYPLFEEKERLNSPAVSKFPFEKENRSLFREIYEIFPQYADRLIPFVMFDPSRETEAQAESLRELNKRYKIRGLKTVTTYTRAFATDFQKQGNPIKQFAYEHKLPVTFHCSWSKADPWANVFDILEIVKANPDLKFCLAHSARFSKKALDMADSLPNCYVDTSALKIHCDLARNENSAAIPPPGERFEADYSCPAKVLEALAKAYPETIIWGTDTPCHYFCRKYRDANGELKTPMLLASYDDEIKILRKMPENIIQKIAYENILNYLAVNP